MIVVLLGPLGSGKSTLVRRLMQLYKERTAVPGGVGHLPLGYKLARGEQRLTVVGNYETTSRTRHGMSQFDRYYKNFDDALRLAVLSQPAIMEGSFTKPDRLWAGWGPQLAASTTVVYLGIDGSRTPRRGNEWTPEGIESYDLAVRKSAEYLTTMGGKLELMTDREEALARVRILVGAPDGQTTVEEDYR